MTRALFYSVLLLLASVTPAPGAEFGANKVDLMVQYLDGSTTSGTGPEGYRRVRLAMAKKAISDARDAGLRFLRVPVAGFFPSELDQGKNDLALWLENPAAFWAMMDQMLSALDDTGLRLVPMLAATISQFPALSNEGVATLVRDSNSASRQLLVKFVWDFVMRYKDRKTILFYELTNEMNLLADVDLRKKCRSEPCVWENFTTSEMINFSREMVRVIKSLDESHLISSGFSIPRAAASHLERQPQFAQGGADWTPDSPEEFREYLLKTHEPFDVISIHIYPGKEQDRFGRSLGQEQRLVADVASAAKLAGKPLFVGEFGDAQGATPFMAQILDEFVRGGVDYAALWVWEFYQTSTYQTRNTEPTRFNVEPGYSDDLIHLLVQAERALGSEPPPPQAGAPPRVVLTWPLPCADVDRPLDVAAVASDGIRGVSKAEFLLEGKLLGVALSAPYTAHFNPLGETPRIAELEARAVSRSGQMASFRSGIRLNGATGPCRVSR